MISWPFGGRNTHFTHVSTDFSTFRLGVLPSVKSIVLQTLAAFASVTPCRRSSAAMAMTAMRKASLPGVRGP